MPRAHSAMTLGFVRLDARRKLPLFRQLYDSIREAILDGRLVANTRLPSSRDLVTQFGVSRTTVVTAIEQLIAEGYLQASVGSGTFVSSEIPNDHPFRQSTRTESLAPQPVPPLTTILSPYGLRAANAGRMGLDDRADLKAFLPGVPALDEFPVEVWSKLVRRTWKELKPRDLSYGDAVGYLPLRKSLANYIGANRGVRCTPNQILIVHGTQQAIDLVARMCVRPGDKVLFENPGYVSARSCFLSHGAVISPMRVDREGLHLAEALESSPTARLAYVTPSHQYPVGITLPVERRLELLNWARQNNGLIIEDDYDSEYRYAEKPIPAMQGLQSGDHSFYIGSLSKVGFPALGLGYLVVPESLANPFERALAAMTRPPSLVDQYVLHEFIREGHFARHLRRMRKTHQARREAFVSEMQKQLPDVFTIIGSDAGLHCAALLEAGRNAEEVVEILSGAGIITRSLSAYYLPGTPKFQQLSGLIFGFACCTPGQIRSAVRKMAKLLR
ncbi:MAG: PLP-dependent aminotransferase family protein [Planctomycetaceae bacterium]